MALAKALLWVTGCTGFAYALLKTITPDESELRKSLPGSHRSALDQPDRFFETLKKAADQKRSMIHEKQSSNTPSDPTVVEK